MDLKEQTEHALKNQREAMKVFHIAAETTTDPLHVERLLATQFVLRERRMALATLVEWVKASEHTSVSDINTN